MGKAQNELFTNLMRNLQSNGCKASCVDNIYTKNCVLKATFTDIFQKKIDQ